MLTPSYSRRTQPLDDAASRVIDVTRRNVARIPLLICACIALATSGCANAMRSKNTVPVLLYHRISLERTAADTEWVPLETFERQMRYLADHGYSTVTASDLVRIMRGHDSPGKAVCITFDDGWKSQRFALPILRRYGLKATFLLFPERGIEDPYDDYLRWAEVRELARDERAEIGAHSMTHPWDRTKNLVTWSEGTPSEQDMPRVHYEIDQSKRLLEQALGRPVTIFAWPMGWYNDALIAVARDAGYQGLLTTEPGGNRPGDDPLRIKRLFVDGSCTLAQFATMLDTLRYPRCASGKPPSTSRTP